MAHCGVTARGAPQDIGTIVASLPIDELRSVLPSAVDRHPDGERHVRLAVARATGDLAELRSEVDRGLRAAVPGIPRERGVGARRAADRRRRAPRSRPSTSPTTAPWAGRRGAHASSDPVALLERAVGHVVKVILRADDSNGTIGDLALRREQHERTASSGTYRALRRAADALDAEELERDAARQALCRRDRGELVDALLHDGDGASVAISPPWPSPRVSLA
jgi:hypothetical protein